MPFPCDSFPQIVPLRLHLIDLVRLNSFVTHLLRQVAAADKIEVEQLDIFGRCVRIHCLKEFLDLFVGQFTQIFNVVIHLKLLKQNFVLVESSKGGFSEG